MTWSRCLGITGFFLMLPSSLARACWGGAGPRVAQLCALLVVPALLRALKTIPWKTQCLPASCNYVRQRWGPGGEGGMFGHR